MTALQTKFLNLEEDLNDVLVERKDEIHTAVLAILAKLHHFQFGPPGIAKSMLVEQVVKRIDGLKEDDLFKILLTKTTVMEELFGGPDFNLLRDYGIYKRRTERKLPVALFAFYDEIFKGSSAILNANLKLLNERQFDNHDDDPNVPLISAFGASNELPATSELDALADRLHFWHYVKPIEDPSEFIKMLTKHIPENPSKTVSLTDIESAQRLVEEVVIPDEVYEVLLELRDVLQKNDVHVTDRKFHNALSAIRAEAFLNGHDVAQITDTKPLMHMLWRDPSQIEVVRRAVLDLADPLERDALALLAELEKAYSDFKVTLTESDNRTVKANHAIDVYGKLEEAKKEWRKLRAREKELGRECDAVVILKKRIKDMGSVLLKEGLGLSSAKDDLEDEAPEETPSDPEDNI